MKETTLTNPDKILYPASGITKAEVVDYYAKIAPRMLPYLSGRPLSLERFPDGIGKEGFFQKTAPPYYPSAIQRIKMKEDEGYKTYAGVEDAEGLVYLASQAALVIHVHQSRKGKLRKPDQVIWDLDPSPEQDFEEVVMGARLLRHFLQELGLEPYLKTSGAKGLHLFIPLNAKKDYTFVKDFSHRISLFMGAKVDELFTTELTKKKRHGRIFLDYLRNQYAHTVAAPFSLRAQPEATISVPIPWEALENPEFTSREYNIKNIFDHLKNSKDPWEGFYDHPQNLVAAEKKLSRLEGKAGVRNEE